MTPLTPLRGKTVRLYIEGLVLVTYDERYGQFQAGILNAEGHQLEVWRLHRKTGDNGWVAGDPKTLYFDRKKLKGYSDGMIHVPDSSGQFRIASMIIPQDEIWLPFNLIPDLEADILEQRVTIKREVVVPVLSMSGAEFYSVLNPEPLGKRHSHEDMHEEKKKESQELINSDNLRPTYRPKSHCLKDVHDRLHDCSLDKVEDIGHLEGAIRGRIKNLAARAYTAATIISLSAGQRLVGKLSGESLPELPLFVVEHDERYEAKVVIRNNIVHPHVARKDEDRDEAPEHYFHFHHFYDAIDGEKPDERVLLCTDTGMINYVNDRDQLIFTGGSHPNCPAIRLTGKI